MELNELKKALKRRGNKIYASEHTESPYNVTVFDGETLIYEIDFLLGDIRILHPVFLEEYKEERKYRLEYPMHSTDFAIELYKALEGMRKKVDVAAIREIARQYCAYGRNGLLHPVG